jgi:hypothetical protein
LLLTERYEEGASGAQAQTGTGPRRRCGNKVKRERRAGVLRDLDGDNRWCSAGCATLSNFGTRIEPM